MTPRRGDFFLTRERGEELRGLLEETALVLTKCVSELESVKERKIPRLRVAEMEMVCDWCAGELEKAHGKITKADQIIRNGRVF